MLTSSRCVQVEAAATFTTRASAVLTEATNVIDCCPLKVNVVGIAFGFVACNLQISNENERSFMAGNSRLFHCEPVRRSSPPAVTLLLARSLRRDSAGRMVESALSHASALMDCEEDAAKAIPCAIGARHRSRVRE